MQTPASPPARPGPGGNHDESVLLNTQVIAQARRTHPRPVRPAHPARPYPPVPAVTAPPATAPAPPTETDQAADDEAPKFSLTGTQVVASMTAAVVAAFIGAQLGVAGTVIGAAIASIISVVGSAVIGHSLLMTRRKVVQTVQQARATGSPPDDQETVLITAVTRVPAPSAPARQRRGWWSRPGRIRWVLVGLAASVAVFAGALGAVTVVEAVKGAPISGGDSGFSVLGGGGSTDGGAGDDTTDGSTDSTPTPTSTATSTESTTAPATTSPTSTTGSSSVEASTSPTASSTTAQSTAPSTTSAPAPASATAATTAATTSAGSTG